MQRRPAFACGSRRARHSIALRLITGTCARLPTRNPARPYDSSRDSSRSWMSFRADTGTSRSLDARTQVAENSACLCGGVLESLVSSRKDRNALRWLGIGGRDRLALLTRDCGERRKERIWISREARSHNASTRSVGHLATSRVSNRTEPAPWMAGYLPVLAN
jgi:hypothetical protein